MGSWIRRYKEPLLIITLIFFFASLFVGVGSVFFVGADTRDLVAKVGSSRITLKPFNANLRQNMEALRKNDPNLDITLEMEQSMKQEILRELIIRELFNIEARRWGIQVAPAEVAADVLSRPTFQKDGRFDPRAYYEFTIRTLGLMPKEFEKERSEDLLSLRFRSLLAGSIASTEQELRWIWEMENPGKKDKDWEKERQDFSTRVFNEKIIALLNQLLSRLAQDHPVQTYLK